MVRNEGDYMRAARQEISNFIEQCGANNLTTNRNDGGMRGVQQAAEALPSTPIEERVVYDSSKGPDKTAMDLARMLLGYDAPAEK